MPLQLHSKEVFHFLKCLTAKKMGKIAITQIRSSIKRPNDQKLTLQALGLGKLNRTVEVEKTPQIQGMVNKVKHLLTVKEL